MQFGMSHGAGTNRTHHYSSADANTTIAASGYFNSATKFLQKGDVLFVTGSIGGTPDKGTYVVTSATGAATVTVA
jgi:hypothetical protein